MSKSATSESGRIHWLVSASWQLAQSIWVGGLWLLQLLVLPAIGQLGLAPLLVQEIADRLTPLLVALAAVCVGVQVAALLRGEGLSHLWRDIRGQLLLAVAGMALAYGLLLHFWPQAEYGLRFCYLAMACSGLLLVLQPVPGQVIRPLR